MRKGFIYICMFLPHLVWANYSIDLEVQIKDNETQKGVITLKEGTTASLSLGEVMVSLKAMSYDKKGVKIETEVFENGPNGKKLVAKPTLNTVLGLPSTMSSRSPDGAQDFRIRILPKYTD